MPPRIRADPDFLRSFPLAARSCRRVAICAVERQACHGAPSDYPAISGKDPISPTGT